MCFKLYLIEQENRLYLKFSFSALHIPKQTNPFFTFGHGFYQILREAVVINVFPDVSGAEGQNEN
jgi:hypothetical protein